MNYIQNKNRLLKFSSKPDKANLNLSMINSIIIIILQTESQCRDKVMAPKFSF